MTFMNVIEHMPVTHCFFWKTLPGSHCLDRHFGRGISADLERERVVLGATWCGLCQWRGAGEGRGTGSYRYSHTDVTDYCSE